MKFFALTVMGQRWPVSTHVVECYARLGLGLTLQVRKIDHSVREAFERSAWRSPRMDLREYDECLYETGGSGAIAS